MKKTLLSLFAVALLLAAPARSRAEDAAGLKPVVVVSLASYDDLHSDLDFIGQLSEQPDLAKSLDGIIAVLTQFQGLAGLDKTKPIGVTVATDGQGFPVLGMIPTKDLKKLFGAFTQYIGQPEDVGGGVFELQAGNIPVFIKEKGGWAFVSQSKDGLDNLPADPMKILGELSKAYDLGVRIHLQNVPKVFRDMALDKFREGLETGLQQKNDELSDDQRKMLQTQMEAMAKNIADIDALTVGWAIDSKSKSTYFDVSVTATPDSKLAEKITAKPSGKSKFAGFLYDEAIASVHAFGAIAADDVASMNSMLASLRKQMEKGIDDDDSLDDEAEKAAVKELANALVDAASATVKGGVIEGGLVVDGEGPFTIALGARVEGADKLEAALKKAIKLAMKKKKNLEDAEIEFDAEEHKGVRFHTLSMPFPENDDDEKGTEQAKKILGEDLEFTFGFGKSSIYFAIGEDGIDTIKDVIDDSASADEPEFPGELNIALLPILTFASKEQPENPILKALVKSLKESGKDRLRITSRLIPNGSLSRFEAEEGVLKMLGVGAKMGRGGF